MHAHNVGMAQPPQLLTLLLSGCEVGLLEDSVGVERVEGHVNLPISAMPQLLSQLPVLVLQIKCLFLLFYYDCSI